MFFVVFLFIKYGSHVNFSGVEKMMMKMECTKEYPALKEKTARAIIEELRRDLENENETVKIAMANELQKIGLTAKAISKLLNITNHRE
jgi:hypothetical protein